MDLGIKIIPPENANEADISQVGNDLKAIEGVRGAGSTQSRAIDPASILLWVKLSAEIISVAGAAVAVIQNILKLLRDKGMSGAQLEFANGTKISVDKASAEDVVKLIEAGNAP